MEAKSLFANVAPDPPGAGDRRLGPKCLGQGLWRGPRPGCLLRTEVTAMVVSPPPGAQPVLTICDWTRARGLLATIESCCGPGLRAELRVRRTFPEGAGDRRTGARAGEERDPFTMKLSPCLEDELSCEGPSDRHPRQVPGSKIPLQCKETRFPKHLPGGFPGPCGISPSSHGRPSEDSCAGKQIRGGSSLQPPLRPMHLGEAVGKVGGHSRGRGPPGGKSSEVAIDS